MRVDRRYRRIARLVQQLLLYARTRRRHPHSRVVGTRRGARARLIRAAVQRRRRRFASATRSTTGVAAHTRRSTGKLTAGANLRSRARCCSRRSNVDCSSRRSRSRTWSSVSTISSRRAASIASRRRQRISARSSTASNTAASR